jgi:Ca2+-binding EF-hand superfamily protein
MKFIGGRLFIVTLMALPVIALGTHLHSQDKKIAGTSPMISDDTVRIPQACGSQIQMDTDEMVVTQEEWNSAFLKIDGSGDKRLSYKEIDQAFRQEERDSVADSNAARTAALVRLDRNQNEVIEFSEWPGKKRTFRYLDMNHDEVLSREEFMSENARWWNLAFEDLDFDGNRMISRKEWMDSDAEFNRLDRNHNGGIERREFYNPR